MSPTCVPSTTRRRQRQEEKTTEALVDTSTGVNARANGKAVRKYLAAHAENTAEIGARIKQRFKHVVVIPAYGEGEILDRAIASIAGCARHATLAVVLINERENSPRTVKLINEKTHHRLQQHYGEHRRLSDNALLCEAPFGALALARVVLPAGQGVGLARKYGADLALGAWASGRIDSSWIHCTDADVQLPADYFCAPQPSASVALHRFRHEAACAQEQTHARIYDIWLRLHVLGLHWAGSPYGFHTIGSTITVNTHSYAAVRGFPRRNAGEDFYFLNKLAKLGAVVSAPSAPLRIAARVSDRVPFGTGRAMGLAQLNGLDALPRFYDPSVYVYLRILLESIEASCETGTFERRALHRALSEQTLDATIIDAAMDALGLDVAINKLLRSSPEKQQRRRAVHCWFDAFRTMKFIHHLRDNGIASVDVDSALNAGQFLLQQTTPSVRDDIGVVSAANCG